MQKSQSYLLHLRPKVQAGRSHSIAVRSILLLIAALVLAACGKVAAPTPPLRFKERTTDLSAIQRGSLVMLMWPAPKLNSPDTDRDYVDHVDIYRVTETRDQEPLLDPDEFQNTADKLKTYDRAEIERQVKSQGHLEYPDPLKITDAASIAKTRLRYAVRYVNKRGQDALFSNTVAVEPFPAIAMAPSALTVEDQGQDVVTVTWTAPAANVDGTQPATIVGYNLYRRNAKRTNQGGPLNKEPITTTTFTDTQFQYGVPYIYSVRALSQGANGLIESADSNTKTFTPKDIYKPSIPDPVTIASANGVISLFWPSVPETDVVGYNVYRADSADAPKDQWIKLTPQPISPVTFRDDSVEIDHTYYYRVTAIDRFNNESDPSSVVSETVHP